MRAIVRRAAEAWAERMEEGRLVALLGRALRGRRICLCLHRVSAHRRCGEVLPKLTIHPAELDRLVELLLATRSRHEGWLTLSFDDGYRDAAEYILSRAPRWPRVLFLFFVCPAKIEDRVGFRWDLAETRERTGRPVDLAALLDEHHPDENGRPELRRLGTHPKFALADLAQCRQIAALPNALLGNHTNAHLRPSRLAPDDFEAECEASLRDFQRLFGPVRHFAFPFGVPGEDFARPHVRTLRSRGSFTVWSTEPRPYAPEEEIAGAVLPRYAVDGTRTFRQTAMWIALNASRARLLGKRHRYLPTRGERAAVAG